uniref:Reticulon-like protein n=1 Tax=Lactuca sativa TaxID=4236 RepID=A0A9R1WU01_LACSA|nr:hypothetical protein LSAT_V11C900456670 [Lactuca sativa]
MLNRSCAIDIGNPRAPLSLLDFNGGDATYLVAGNLYTLLSVLEKNLRYLDRLKSLFSVANILLWRQKKMYGAILVSAIVIWLLFVRIGYHLVPFFCHFLILALVILVIWSNLSSFVNKSPVNFPDIRLSQELCDCVALLLKDQINQGCLYLRQMTIGKYLKIFMSLNRELDTGTGLPIFFFRELAASLALSELRTA